MKNIYWVKASYGLRAVGILAVLTAVLVQSSLTYVSLVVLLLCNVCADYLLFTYKENIAPAIKTHKNKMLTISFGLWVLWVGLAVYFRVLG